MTRAPLARYGSDPLEAGLSLTPLPDPPPEEGLVVERSPEGHLRVRRLGPGAPGALLVDHRSPESARRFSEGKKGLLGRASGIARGSRPVLWDATGGLGRDALQLARLGATVTLWERDPVVRALCREGLQRVGEGEDELAEAARERVTVREGSAVEGMAEHLRSGASPPEVILLDPMFPERGSALPKLEAQMLAALCGEGGCPEEERALFEAAVALRPHRVVVKRPRHAPEIAGQPADQRFEGRSVRFDLYLPRTPSGA
ncbi:MAG: class I SAM-dependent methyltransferase [Planctomycetota bacterium]|jgi:16S rRNA (guanine1516-N2)-methyltransferase